MECIVEETESCYGEYGRDECGAKQYEQAAASGDDYAGYAPHHEGAERRSECWDIADLNGEPHPRRQRGSSEGDGAKLDTLIGVDANDVDKLWEYNHSRGYSKSPAEDQLIRNVHPQDRVAGVIQHTSAVRFRLLLSGV